MQVDPDHFAPKRNALVPPNPKELVNAALTPFPSTV